MVIISWKNLFITIFSASHGSNSNGLDPWATWKSDVSHLPTNASRKVIITFMQQTAWKLLLPYLHSCTKGSKKTTSLIIITQIKLQLFKHKISFLNNMRMIVKETENLWPLWGTCNRWKSRDDLICVAGWNWSQIFMSWKYKTVYIFLILP